MAKSYSLAISHIPAFNFHGGQDMVQERNTSLLLEPSGNDTSQPMIAMDVSEDEANKVLLKLNEDKLRNL